MGRAWLCLEVAASSRPLPLSWSAVELGLKNNDIRDKPLLPCLNRPSLILKRPASPTPCKYPRGPGSAACARRQNGRGCLEESLLLCVPICNGRCFLADTAKVWLAGWRQGTKVSVHITYNMQPTNSYSLVPSSSLLVGLYLADPSIHIQSSPDLYISAECTTQGLVAIPAP